MRVHGGGSGQSSMFAGSNSSLRLKNSPGRESRSPLLGLVPVAIVQHQPTNYGRTSPATVHVVQWLSRVWLFMTPWTAACQASLSFTRSQSLFKFMSIELVMPSNHLILCHPLHLLRLIFPSIRVFSNESALRIRCQSIEASASASVLLLNLQGWFPLGLSGLISLLSKGLSRDFSSTTVWKH